MARLSFSAAEDALVTALQARGGLSGVKVQAGLPTEVPTQRERIYTVEMRDHQRVAIGDHARGEGYSIAVLVEVHKLGQSRAVVQNRCEALIDELDTELIGPDQLSGAVWEAALDKIESLATMPTTDNGFISKALVLVSVATVVGRA